MTYEELQAEIQRSDRLDRARKLKVLFETAKHFQDSRCDVSRGVFPISLGTGRKDDCLSMDVSAAVFRTVVASLVDALAAEFESI